MQRFRNILVGVSLTHADRLVASELESPTQEAVRRAKWLAGHTSARLTFFSALDLSPQTVELLDRERASATATVKDEAERVLDELVAEAQSEGIEAGRQLAIGKEWVEIIRQVLRNEHDLLIVGTRGRSRIGGMLLGSTSMKVLRYCPCPVWVTRPDPNWDDLNILVATDFGDVSRLALEMAVNLGQLASGKLLVVHAVEYGLERHLLRADADEEQFARFREQRRAEAEQRLTQQLSQTDYRTLTYGVQTHVAEGPADIVILDAIQQHGIDLLVMGTIGRGGLPGLFVGNTAERLLPQVPCSVLAVKPADFPCPISL